MTAPRKAVRRPKADPFHVRFSQFLANKKMIEALTLRNDGDKKKEISGIKQGLLSYVKENGEKDPDSGSFFLTLDEPVEVEGVRFKGAKAERRAPKTLNEERAREMLAEKDLLEDVQRFRYVLLLTKSEAEDFAALLEEEDYTASVESTDEVLLEDAILEAHYMDKERLSAEEIDSLYDVDETWAFVPQKV